MLTETISYPAEAHLLTRKIEDDSFWYKHRNDIIINALHNFVGRDKTIYDLGGGNGIVAKAIQDAGYTCVLVEALPAAIEEAKKRKIDTVIQSNIESFINKDLDAIMLLDVIEHIEDDTALLLQLHNQLNPGGRLIITVPAFQHLTTNIDKEIGHFRRYNLNKLAALLQKTGYQVEFKTYFFSLLYLPTLIARLLPYKLGIKNNDRKNRRNKEHLVKMPLLNKIALFVFGFENTFIRKKIKLLLGTSCLIIVQKPYT